MLQHGKSGFSKPDRSDEKTGSTGVLCSMVALAHESSVLIVSAAVLFDGFRRIKGLPFYHKRLNILYLYILQHGDAESKEVNPVRPLSAQGLRDIRLLALHMQNVGVQLGHIFHSGKRRAEQTAGLIANKIPPGTVPVQTEGLMPNDDPAAIVSDIESMQENILIVSHMPFVSRLCSLLLTGAAADAYASVPGTLICLEQAEGKWRLAYMLRPEFL